MELSYQIEPELGTDEFVDVLRRSTLAERRPVREAVTIAGMLKNAGLIVTARYNQRLVSVARAISDYAYCTYLSDLAVDVAYQRQGIGRELIRRTREATGANTMLILLSAPDAASYYRHIGMTPHDSCWVLFGSESCELNHNPRVEIRNDSAKDDPQ
jgi:GNAT superfamily N-acetyltransferase